MKEKKWNKIKIRVGSSVKAKVGKMEGKKKGRMNQEDKERGGGMCPDCSEEEEILNSI